MAKRKTAYRTVSVRGVQIIPSAVAESAFDRPTLQGLLDQCPKWIYEAGHVQTKCDKALNELEDELKVAMAKHQLTASSNKDNSGLSNAEDRKAYVTTQKDVMDLSNQIILAKADLANSKLQKEKYENYFTAVRKHASLLISEDELTRADKYQKPTD